MKCSCAVAVVLLTILKVAETFRCSTKCRRRIEMKSSDPAKTCNVTSISDVSWSNSEELPAVRPENLKASYRVMRRKNLNYIALTITWRYNMRYSARQKFTLELSRSRSVPVSYEITAVDDTTDEPRSEEHFAYRSCERDLVVPGDRIMIRLIPIPTYLENTVDNSVVAIVTIPDCYELLKRRMKIDYCQNKTQSEKVKRDAERSREAKTRVKVVEEVRALYRRSFSIVLSICVFLLCICFTVICIKCAAPWIRKRCQRNQADGSCEKEDSGGGGGVVMIVERTIPRLNPFTAFCIQLAEHLHLNSSVVCNLWCLNESDSDPHGWFHRHVTAPSSSCRHLLLVAAPPAIATQPHTDPHQVATSWLKRHRLVAHTVASCGDDVTGRVLSLGGDWRKILQRCSKRGKVSATRQLYEARDLLMEYLAALHDITTIATQ